MAKDPTTGLYAPGCGESGVFVYNPAEASGGIEDVTMMPALMLGEPPAPPAAASKTAAAEVGTFLVAYSGIEVGGVPALQIIRVDDPLAPIPPGAVFTVSYVLLGPVDDIATALPAAPQMDDMMFPSPAPLPTTAARSTLCGAAMPSGRRLIMGLMILGNVAIVTSGFARL